MGEWVRLCSTQQAPKPGEATETEAKGVALCLANIGGKLSALDNWCPHRRGPLGQGWLEGNAVVCPWHAWAFDATTGVAHEPEKARVDVFPVKTESGEIFVDIG